MKGIREGKTERKEGKRENGWRGRWIDRDREKKGKEAVMSRKGMQEGRGRRGI